MTNLGPYTVITYMKSNVFFNHWDKNVNTFNSWSIIQQHDLADLIISSRKTLLYRYCYILFNNMNIIKFPKPVFLNLLQPNTPYDT